MSFEQLIEYSAMRQNIENTVTYLQWSCSVTFALLTASFWVHLLRTAEE